MHADDKELFAALVLAIIDLDNERYDLGNYFLFSDEAKQVLESKEYKDFWSKVRNNKIGG